MWFVASGGFECLIIYIYIYMACNGRSLHIKQSLVV